MRGDPAEITLLCTKVRDMKQNLSILHNVLCVGFLAFRYVETCLVKKFCLARKPVDFGTEVSCI